MTHGLRFLRGVQHRLEGQQNLAAKGGAQLLDMFVSSVEDPISALQRMVHRDLEAAPYPAPLDVVTVGLAVAPIGVPGAKGVGRLAPEVLEAAAGTRFVNRTIAAQAAEGGAVGAAEGATGRFVLGEASEIRKINIRPKAADPNWGLTPAHLDKHFFGSGKYSLSKIDPGGTSDQWMHNLTELYNSPVTGTTKNGMLDIVKQFPRADGSGTYAMGIRITPQKPDGTYDLITILTRQ